MLAALSSDEVYRSAWGTPKYLTVDLTLILALGFGAFALAILGVSNISMTPRTSTLSLNPSQLRYLNRTYTILFWLAIFGYAAWTIAGGLGGVSLNNLRAVFDRQLGAISDLKSAARPIAGLTTLTQLAPLCCAVGALLLRMGQGRRGFWLLVALAAARTLLYAERLAILEVVVPIVVIYILTPGVDPKSTHRTFKRKRHAPAVALPLIWALFAASEYTRSWVFYQYTTHQTFPEWVTYRLLGYYSTAYNNSALFALNREGHDLPPYFTIDAFWNAPGISKLFTPPDVPLWWGTVLQQNGNPEYNSVGSFLTSYAELGIIGMLIFWILAGLAVGHIFKRSVEGRLAALLLYSVLYIGILELPRYIYWAQGRFTPGVIALLIFAIKYPRTTSREPAARPWREPRGRQNRTRVASSINKEPSASSGAPGL